MSPIQLAIGTSGWAIFIHQPLGAFDLTGKQGVLQPATPEGALPIDLFVIESKDPAVIMAEYAKITGLPEMPPLWSFGYQQSHRTLGPPEEILQEARLFREKKLPCDAMIYLGTDFCPNGWNTHNGEFTWNSKPFPDPKRAIDDLHAEHFKVVLHTVIEGRKMTGTVHDACTAAPLPSGRTPDNRWPPDRQVSCYWPVHKPLLDLGIDGWWPDQGDGLDAASRLARNRMYFEGTQMYRPNERVYALHRNGFAGMQRFAVVPVVGRRTVHVGDAEDPRSGGRQHGAQRHSLLGHRYRGLYSHQGSDCRILCALVPVLRLQSTFPRARAHLETAPALGMEHGRPRSHRNTEYHPARKRTAQRRDRAHLPQVPERALPDDALSVQPGPRIHADRACRFCAPCGCTIPTTRPP